MTTEPKKLMSATLVLSKYFGPKEYKGKKGPGALLEELKELSHEERRALAELAAIELGVGLKD
tara:strand:+ start:760 stop:948 length:189 start_codon:yes stop_codon:yes gene_type:complete